MNRADLKELHYITPLANIPSIMQRGILCKNRANELNPASIAMPEIQQLRARKSVPGGLQIHDYVNFYFCARNPMMYKRSSMDAILCVLRINTSVLDLKNAVIADSNVASKYVAFWPSPSGLSKINDAWVFADDWTDGDQITQWQKAAAKCAEVLVHGVVSPDRVTGAYVSCPESEQTLIGTGFDKGITINPHLFFRR